MFLCIDHFTTCKNCGFGDVSCDQGAKCLDPKQICNDVEDCIDKSDEMACSKNKVVSYNSKTRSAIYCNYILSTKLTWPGDSEGTYRSSCHPATRPPVYHTIGRDHTVPLIGERQARKL